MVLDFFRSFLPPDNIPNRFTFAVGELIQKARIEAGLTQQELSRRAYIPQSTLSKMENGKIEPSASELVYLSNALDKPLLHFFPNQIIRNLELDVDTNNNLIEELILLSGKLEENELRKIIAQIRAIIELEKEIGSKK
mgnify:CR=1 FL=1